MFFTAWRGCLHSEQEINSFLIRLKKKTCTPLYPSTSPSAACAKSNCWSYMKIFFNSWIMALIITHTCRLYSGKPSFSAASSKTSVCQCWSTMITDQECRRWDLVTPSDHHIFLNIRSYSSNHLPIIHVLYLQPSGSRAYIISCSFLTIQNKKHKLLIYCWKNYAGNWKICWKKCKQYCLW